MFKLFIFVTHQAIWYTETAGVEGPAFGNSNTWKGLGVFCDSFDNDQQVGKCCLYLCSGHEHSFISL